ncbi:MAG: hypothetical protein ACR2JW_15475 [Thermomicrobiales bacterium]
MAESAAQEQPGQHSNGLSLLTGEERADALIAQYIEPHPGNPGIAEYRLRVEQNGYPVWAIIGSLPAYGDDIEQAARDYAVSREAIEAARAFYQRHREAIDDRLAANRAH